MEVQVTGDLEAKLTHSDARQGRNPEELVHDMLTHYFEEEARFADAVKRGEEALHRGEYLTHEQVGRRLRRFLETYCRFVGRCPRRKTWSAFANAHRARRSSSRLAGRRERVLAPLPYTVTIGTRGTPLRLRVSSTVRRIGRSPGPAS